MKKFKNNGYIKKIFLLFLVCIFLFFLYLFFLDKKVDEHFSWKENPDATFAIFDQTEVMEKYYTKEELKEMQKVNMEGYNTFLIVPKKPETKIQIYSQFLNDQGEMEVMFYKEVIGSFLLKCNTSDLYSNVLLKVITDDKTYEYSPYYSLKDGHLMIENYILYIQQ